MFSRMPTDLHPFVVHFPVALLAVAVLSSLLARLWSAREVFLSEGSYLVLVVGAPASLVASVTGLIAHFPYEETPLHDVIERHQLLGLGTTFLFCGLLAWRWRSRARGGDSGRSWAFQVLGVAGLAALLATGATGGALVYEHGVNVQTGQADR